MAEPEEKKTEEPNEFDRVIAGSKKFTENARVFHQEGHIILVLYSGGTSESYVLTPQNAKRLGQLIGWQIGNYEGFYGAVQASFVPPSIPSPLQQDDLNSPPDSSAPPAPEAGESPSGNPGKKKK